MSITDRRREFTGAWIAALEKLGPHFCLPSDLPSAVRERIGALEQNARNGAFAYVHGVVSLTELRATIALWADAVRAASMALEPKVLQ
jgi:putative heme degradation protein